MKEHRNTYATYNAEKANHFIRKITISNIKEAVGTTTKVYDLTEFDDQLTIFRQYCAYITNTLSTKTTFFTETTAKRLYIDLRDSLGVTGKKDPLKRSGKSVKVEISLRDAAPFHLDITMTAQSFSEFVYE